MWHPAGKPKRCVAARGGIAGHAVEFDPCFHERAEQPFPYSSRIAGWNHVEQIYLDSAESLNGNGLFGT